MKVRHLTSLFLPIIVVAITPWRLRRSPATDDSHWLTGTPAASLARPAGAAVFVAGFGLFVWCVALFTRQGRGTIMPWDPTQQIVVRGPYRHVRNPMISSVLCMLMGQALFFGSRLTAAWAGFFFLINHLYFIHFEEPGLEKRFGDDYRQYKAAVPRWVPRLKPNPDQ
jgi:protein-S-isoprenylcysteine O-methyltransferase Ste14